jgi:hypothetical protein
MRAVLVILLAAGTSTAGAQTAAPGSTASAVGPVRTITPVSAGALGPAPTRPADLVFPLGPIVAGKAIAWSHPITLYDADAIGFENGRCVFDLFYDIANAGLTATPPFENWVRAVPLPVRNASALPAAQPPSTQPGLTLGPKTSKRVHSKAIAGPGPWALVFHADVTGAVPEKDEQNNEQRVQLTVAGACGTMSGPPKDHEHYLSEHITLGHVRIAGLIPPPGSAEPLDARNAKSYREGTCLFEVTYEVKNDGPLPTAGFHSLVGVKSVSNQEPAIPALGPGQMVAVKILSPFRPGDNEVGILSVGNLNPLLASAQNFWSGHVAVHGSCEPPPLTPPGSKPDSKRATPTVEPAHPRP